MQVVKTPIVKNLLHYLQQVAPTNAYFTNDLQVKPLEFPKSLRLSTKNEICLMINTCSKLHIENCQNPIENLIPSRFLPYVQITADAANCELNSDRTTECLNHF